MTNMMLLGVACTVAAYLLGSFSSAIIVTRLMGLPDPRTSGSGNPGATNVLRLGGKKAAALTLFFDTFKGLLAVLIAAYFTQQPSILMLTALGAFLGHLYPLFFHFHGGKGVATGFGVILGLAWPVALCMLGTWLLMAALFRYSSLAALTAAGLAPLYMSLLGQDTHYILGTALISVLLAWRHRANIRNLFQGCERKIG